MFSNIAVANIAVVVILAVVVSHAGVVNLALVANIAVDSGLECGVECFTPICTRI